MPEQLAVNAQSERMSTDQFKELFGQVERIFAQTDAEDLMSLGPTIVNAKGAVEDGWIDSIRDFKPMLRATAIYGLDIEIAGTEYSGIGLFFKQGGNDDAEKNWLGDIHFTNDDSTLEYKFHKNGRIKITEQTANSYWLRYCWARRKDAEELNGALIKVKEHLHAKSVGQIALTE